MRSKIFLVDRLLKFLSFMLFIAEHLALCSMKSRKAKAGRYSTEIIFSTLFFSYYIYTVLFEFSTYQYSQFFRNSLISIGNVAILLSGLTMVFCCNLNRFYFKNEMPIWFKKLNTIEKKLNFSGFRIDYKKQHLLIYFFISFVLSITVTTICAEWISYFIHVTKITISTLVAFSLVLLTVSFNCCCFNILFYIVMRFITYTNDKLHKYFQILKTSRLSKKIYFNRIIIELKILNELYDAFTMFLKMFAIINMIIICIITVMTVFHVYFLILYISHKSTIQTALMKYSIINFLCYIHIIMFVMIYVVQKCIFEVTI